VRSHKRRQQTQEVTGESLERQERGEGSGLGYARRIVCDATGRSRSSNDRTVRGPGIGTRAALNVARIWTVAVSCGPQDELFSRDNGTTLFPLHRTVIALCARVATSEVPGPSIHSRNCCSFAPSAFSTPEMSPLKYHWASAFRPQMP